MGIPKVSSSEGNLQERIARNLAERDELMKEALASRGIENGEHFRDKAVPQSLLFMVELIPYIHRLYEHEPENSIKTVLDVGPENMAGTALLRDIHHPNSFNRLKLKVDALDVTNDFVDFGRIVAPGIDLIVSDIFQIKDRSWDFLIASHVIEHVPRPLEFLSRMQSLSHDFVLVACPWREFPIVTKTHINTIDKEITRRAGARDLKIFTNFSWGKKREVCVFWLPGTAKSG